MVASRLGVVLLVLGGLVGCSKETPPAAEEPHSASNAAAPQGVPQAATSAAAADPPAPAAPTGEPKVSDTGYDLSLESTGAAAKVGQPGSVQVVLLAKPPFHVNDKYPIKLKLKETPGVKYESLVIGKDAVKLEAMKAVMPVTFTPDGAGKRTIAGQFAFSVCTSDKCLMEKRDLALDVTVE